MNHANMYAVGLALCTFANIASEEMSRDLANEIEKLLGSTNTYIRKKARKNLSRNERAIFDHFSGGPLCSTRSAEGAGAYGPLHHKIQELTGGSKSWCLTLLDNTHDRNVSSG